MNSLNKKGLVAAELLSIIVIPGSLTILAIYFISKKLGLDKKIKNLKFQLQNRN